MKWPSIRDKKPSAIVAAVPTVIAFIAAMTFMVAVGVVLTATGCTWAAMRRKSRRKRFLSNLYLFPESGIEFNSRLAHLKTGSEG